MEFEVINDVRNDKEKVKDFTQRMRYVMELEKQRKQLEKKGLNNLSTFELKEYTDLGVNINLQRMQNRLENLENIDLRR